MYTLVFTLSDFGVVKLSISRYEIIPRFDFPRPKHKVNNIGGYLYDSWNPEDGIPFVYAKLRIKIDILIYNYLNLNLTLKILIWHTFGVNKPAK